MLSERADLVARLSLDDKLSGQAARASSNFSKSMGKIGASARKGVGTAAGNIQKIGVIAATAVAGAVVSGVRSLATLEDAVTSIDGALKATTKGWKITGAQIASISNDIERNVQAAFDDKDIAQGTATLIRYGGVTQAQLPKAMQVMTDLAARTGDVGSASSALAKAMADPTKATRLLRTAGVSLTKEQEKQIKKWVESGKKAKAQAFLLDLVAARTKGAAAAMHGPLNDAINLMHDAWEDTTKALATGFLPVIEEVANFLSTELAKKETLDRIKEFGTGLAGGFKQAVEFAKKIDWNSIGSSLKTAADGAKGVLNMFMGMPDWVKTAVLTGWGLNKLTGGAVSDILGTGIEVGIKGIFGQWFARGSSFANPMYVTAVGGLGGGAAGGVAGAGAAAGGGALAGLLGTAGILAGFAAIGESLGKLPGELDAFGKGITSLNNKDLPGAHDAFQDFINGLPEFNPFAPNKQMLQDALNSGKTQEVIVKNITDLDKHLDNPVTHLTTALGEASRAAIKELTKQQRKKYNRVGADAEPDRKPTVQKATARDRALDGILGAAALTTAAAKRQADTWAAAAERDRIAANKLRIAATKRDRSLDGPRNVLPTGADRSADAIEKMRGAIADKTQATTDATRTAGINQIAAQRIGAASIVAAIAAKSFTVAPLKLIPPDAKPDRPQTPKRDLDGPRHPLPVTADRSADAIEKMRAALITKTQATTDAVTSAKTDQIAAQRTGDASIVAAIKAKQFDRVGADAKPDRPKPPPPPPPTPIVTADRSADAIEKMRSALTTKTQATTDAVTSTNASQIAAQRIGAASIVAAIKAKQFDRVGADAKPDRPKPGPTDTKAEKTKAAVDWATLTRATKTQAWRATNASRWQNTKLTEPQRAKYSRVGADAEPDRPVKTGDMKWKPAGVVQVEDRRGELRSADAIERLRGAFATKLQTTTDTARTAGINTVSATQSGAASVVSAIQNIPAPIVNVNVSATITSSSIARAHVTQKTYSTGHLASGGTGSVGVRPR